MKKKILISTTILLTTQLFSESFLIKLDNKIYDNLSIQKVEEKIAEEDISQGLGTNEVIGWKNFAEYGAANLSDEDFINAVSEMKIGIKIVNGSSYAFISADKLRNASCFNITEVSSLRDNNGQPYPHLFHNEASGCDAQGTDYDKLYINTYSIVYNYTGYWDEVVGTLPADNTTKFYIY